MLINNNYDTNLFNEYEKLIELCHEKGVKVLGVLMPLSNETLQLIDTDSSWQKWQLKLDNLSLDGIVSFRNKFVNNQEYFLNSDHLNMQGAEIFTKIFLDELMSNGH